MQSRYSRFVWFYTDEFQLILVSDHEIYEFTLNLTLN